MAKSKYEYVKMFEEQQSMLENTFIVARLDGNNFTNFARQNGFIKPNDHSQLNLMNEAAKSVMIRFSEIILAYGQSDEYSFLFKRTSKVFNRRKEKILSCLVSHFTAVYVMNYTRIMNREMIGIPSFDCRLICYPTFQNLKDYFSWRQVDCHINNLYNTCYWCLIKDNHSPNQAQQILSKAAKGQKNELLFTKYQINYNEIEQIYRKGTILIRRQKIQGHDKQQIKKVKRVKAAESSCKSEIELQNDKPDEMILEPDDIASIHEDLIQDNFWLANKENLQIEEIKDLVKPV